MSDSNISGIHLSQVLQDSGRNARAEKNTLQIISLPKDTENRNPDEPVRGKIIARERDGTIRIRTEKGDIIAKAEDAPRLKEGDIVDIKIPKGNLPKTAHVRPVPPQTQEAPPAQPDEQIIVPLPPPLKIPEIITGKPIPVLPIPVQQITNIVRPFIENLPASSLQTPPPLTQIYIPADLNTLLLIPEDILSMPILSVTPEDFPPLEFGAIPTLTVPSEESAEDSKTSLGAPPVTLPLRKILPLLIARPPEQPISIMLDTIFAPDMPPPSIYVGKIGVENIALPQPVFSEDGKPEMPADGRTAGKPETLAKILEGKAWSMTGTVIGLTPEKHLPVIQTSFQGAERFFAIQAPIEGLEIGSQIHFIPLPEGQNLLLPSLPVLSVFPPLSAFPVPETWSTLQEISQQLFQTAPQEAQALHALIPKAATPSQLASSVLFFIAATRAGDIQGWLGDKAVDALKRAGKSDLLTKLEKDISGLARDNISQEWRTASVPLAHGQDIHRIVLHYKKEQHSENDNQKKSGMTRFVMDLNLSHIGKVQLDGLFRGDEKGIGRLDLALRTQSPFSQPMQAEMRRVYKAALDETRFTGELSFQNEPEKWVHITPEKSGIFTRNI